MDRKRYQKITGPSPSVDPAGKVTQATGTGAELDEKRRSEAALYPSKKYVTPGEIHTEWSRSH
ncbi:MAG: hypothetical protein SPI16_06755 [Porphyromonas sp.]|nr:hypothetical protein [Bacteroidales bacterium]MDY6102722.1 hypothetical protein [Porphyromonas sp.]